MAASDYTSTGSGTMLAHATLSEPLTHLAASMTIEGLTSNAGNAPASGAVAMIGDEFCRVTSVAGVVIGIERGCADTIPEPHSIGTDIWFFTTNLGSDRVTYAAGTTVGVKILPFTGSDEVPVAAAPPHTIAFNWRHARPYAPGNMQCGGVPWFDHRFEMTIDLTSLDFTWAHRDRLVQLDQLIGHTASSIGPEAGVTYRVRIYDDADTLVRSVTNIGTPGWSYSRSMAESDFGATGVHDAKVLIDAIRDDLESRAEYTVQIRVHGSGAVSAGLGNDLGNNLGGTP